MTAIEEQNKRVIQETFAHWKQHPGTGLIIKCIERWKEKHLDNAIARVSSQTIPDSEFRRYLSNVQTIETTLWMMNNFDAFWKMIEENKKQ